MPRMFDPWVGAAYRAADVRVLVLGESHYGPPEIACTHLTTGIVRRLGQQEPDAFFTKIRNLLGGADLDRGAFWETVAFYNYVQCLLDRPRLAPTEQQWITGDIEIVNTVNDLAPHLILILGKRLRHRAARYLEESGIPIVTSMHPSSSRFTYEPTRTQLEAAITQIRNAREHA